MQTEMPGLDQSDIAAHLHSQTSARAHEEIGPLMLTRGDGVFVEDENGQRYLEAMSGLWYANLGFSNARLIEAARCQLETLPCYHTFNHRSNDKCATLAYRLSQIVPLPSPKLFFVNSGSEAIDTMVKASWYYHAARGDVARRKIITRDGAFHGSSVFGAVLSGLPHMHDGFNLPAHDLVLRTCSPSMYRLANEGESEGAFCDRMIGHIQSLIEREGADTIAAMIAEPVIGGGGVIIPPKGYFQKLSTLLQTHGILLLMDEVICGFGRTGNWFGCQTFDARPDMIAMAKGLTAGYIPMGAVALSDHIYQTLADQSETLGVFGHGYTYSGHPTASAIALEALTIYQEMNAPRQAQMLGERLQSGLDQLSHHPLVGDVRRAGFIAGVELVADKANKMAFPNSDMVGRQVERNALGEGLIVRNMNDTIALCPPFIISDDELEMIASRLTAALDKTLRSIAISA